MKTLALFTIFVLISGTASTSFANNAYAQNDPYILSRIAIQADKQIFNQLDRIYGDSVPSDIEILYQKGHIAVESLENSLPDDVEEAKENFLTAMKAFKQITGMISKPTSEKKNTPNDVQQRDLTSELNRLHKYFQNIKKISERHDTGIDLSGVEQLFVQAHQEINSDEIEAATQTIEQLESLIEIIKQNIHEHESHSTSDRSKNFALKQLDRIKAELDKAKSVDPDIPELEKANSLIQEIEILISEDNISDAKKKFPELIKLVKTIKKWIDQIA